MGDVTLLCAADLHLGRRPVGLREAGAERLSASGAWSALVDRARGEAVDAVLLAGDIVDRFNRSFEAYGPLQRGVRALAAAGIPVVAVAGNHDHDTLHDVAAEVGEGNLLVLGRGGEWERWTLESGGVPVLHVDGWSFPEGHWPDDPTAGYDPAALGETRGAPLIGLVHGDLDQPGSPYGPLSGARLRSLAPAAWVLGHVHVPRLDESPGLAPILYPGSLQALDPGETGARGAWIVELGSGRRPTFRRVRLSSVRYDRVDVSVEGVEDAPGLHAAVRRALQRHLDELAEESGPLRVVHCRVRLTGRTSLHGRIERALEGLGDLQPANEAGLRLVVDPRPIVDTRPALDLESLARGSDAPALLAKLLLELDGPGPSGLPEGLAELAAHAAVEAAGRSHYLTAGLEPLDLSVGSSRLHEGVRRQAARLLDVLTSQKEGA